MAATLMIIDDDEDDIELFCEAVRGVDRTIQCLSAKSSEEALEMLSLHTEYNPDCIFLDLNMPRMNGKQCLVKLKEIPHLIHVPIIIFSTSKKEKYATEVKQLGAVAFLTKPSRQSDLILAIQWALDHDWDAIETLIPSFYQYPVVKQA